jgi:hypothetical protein
VPANHRGFDGGVPQQSMHRTDVIPVFQQVGGERISALAKSATILEILKFHFTAPPSHVKLREAYWK